MDRNSILLLVGDNPFHGISHLSQRRSRERAQSIEKSEYAAKLVASSLENGAEGFMFSVSDTTLPILETLRERETKEYSLFALVPYAYDYVRLATQVGGVSGLAKKMIKEILFSFNVKAIYSGIKGVARSDLASLLQTYLYYEISRVKSAAGKKAKLEGIFLHEIITEMALSLDLDWIVNSYVDFLSKRKIIPGFETRNFAYIVNKFEEWNIDFEKVLIATPFNSVGFQMNPSREVCETALEALPAKNTIAMSVLAAGYANISDAVEYLRKLRNLFGVVVGVSKEKHAQETFRSLKSGLL